MPLGVLAASVLVALSIIIFEPSFISRSSNEVESSSTASEQGVDCAGTLSNDYACYQGRYQDLVYGSGVQAAFEELKEQYAQNSFVKSNCHQLVHVIGRAAVDLYGDMSGAYSRGDHFCGSGYFHGASEAIVEKIGADKILDEADALCADLRSERERSLYHYNCAHGLGHGFMSILDNELFESLEACDALKDGWEQDKCYGGVFMQNWIAEEDPNHPSRYLKKDQPLYPCTDVETRYKGQCYTKQVQYVLSTQDNDFAKVFSICSAAEVDFRPTCYRSLGGTAASWSIRNNVGDVAETESANELCLLGEDYEARSNCITGAVVQFVYHYHDDTQAKAFCESLDADFQRELCLQSSEEYYESFEA